MPGTRTSSFIRCVQRCGKAAKGADNTVCETVCISARMCQKTKRNSMALCSSKPHQAFAQKAVIYALPVLVVLTHVYPLLRLHLILLLKVVEVKKNIKKL